MRIAICDNNIKNLDLIKQMIYCYADKCRLDIVVDNYTYGEKMLTSKKKYDLVILSFCLTGKNGLEIAKEIRRCGSIATIIFTSSDTDLILEALKLNPFRFLITPLNPNDLFSALDEYFKGLTSNIPLCVKSGKDTVCLNTADIIYIEADNKHCIIHTTSEIIPCNRTMGRLYEILPKSRFFKINRAFIVNSNFINRFNNEEVTLKNGCSLRISRCFLNDFKCNYQKYINPLLV